MAGGLRVRQLLNEWEESGQLGLKGASLRVSPLTESLEKFLLQLQKVCMEGIGGVH